MSKDDILMWATIAIIYLLWFITLTLCGGLFLGGLQ